jgi:hypothetical protein
MIANSQVDDDPLFRKVMTVDAARLFLSIRTQVWSTCAVSWRLEVGGVSHGRKDLRQTMTPAQFISGGTIGPVRANGRSA